MKKVERSDNSEFKNLKLLIYLIPIIGFFPSLWTLYRHGNQKQPSSSLLPSQLNRELTTSRLAITLSGCWLLGYILLGFGAETSEFLALRLLVLNTLLTSGYFLVSIVLMIRLTSGKSPQLPGFSRLARVIGKHLS